MWTKTLSNLLCGYTLLSLFWISYGSMDDQICKQEIWDNSSEGRGLKKVNLDCLAGSVEWHAPYGGLYVTIKGPAAEHQLCIQASSYHTGGVISSIADGSPLPKRLITLKEVRTDSYQKSPKNTVCFLAHGVSVLLLESEVGAPLSSNVMLDYDIESSPRYGEDACRPCTDEELLYHYCASDFVGIGRMLGIKAASSNNIISVSLDFVKQQSSKYFSKDTRSPNKYGGFIYTPAQCKMEYGREKFVFMGKIKFGKAQLRCAPTYDDFQELQQTSKLKGTTLCS